MGFSYGCWVQSFSAQKAEVDTFTVECKQRTEIDEADVPALHDTHTYEEVEALERATRFTLGGKVKG